MVQAGGILVSGLLLCEKAVTLTFISECTERAPISPEVQGGSGGLARGMIYVNNLSLQEEKPSADPDAGVAFIPTFVRKIWTRSLTLQNRVLLFLLLEKSADGLMAARQQNTRLLLMLAAMHPRYNFSLLEKQSNHV